MAGRGRKFTFFGMFRSKRAARKRELPGEFIIPCKKKHRHGMFCLVKKKV